MEVVDEYILLRDANEKKLPLLWAKGCELIYRQCQYSENTVIAARALKGLARTVLTVADDGGQGWGILGAIGLRKSSQLSIRYDTNDYDNTYTYVV